MSEQIIPYQSLRFFPVWANNSPLQVIGLIEMVNYVLDSSPNASNWLEIGSYIGESVSIFLGFPKIKKLQSIEITESFVKILESKYHTYIKNGRYSVYCANSSSYVTNIYDESLDVVYIDGDHSYASVMQDINQYYQKIKCGGFLCGHDYFQNGKVLLGVYNAVNEFMSQNDQLNIKYFCDGSWAIRKK